MIADKTIFHLLGMLDSGEQSKDHKRRAENSMLHLTVRLCSSVSMHSRSYAVHFATHRAIVLKATIFIGNVTMNRLYLQADKYGNFNC